jgi:hypothetical protein
MSSTQEFLSTNNNKKLENIDCRYMLDNRKHYYLASNKDSVQTLLEKQKEDLTIFLTSLKFEYNNLIRERNIIIQNTNDLDLKMNTIKLSDKKSNRVLNKVRSQNDILKDSITNMNQNIYELQFEQKTLKNILKRVKNDITVIEKQCNMYNDQGTLLDKEITKHKMESNNILLNKNNVYGKILDQKTKNLYDKNEYDLQIQYYRTIIDQKKGYILAQDERKQKQRELETQEKKNTSDKLEVEGRKKLLLLKLINNYYEKKMELLLHNDEKIERIFQEIKYITGTQDLNKISEDILNKNKEYEFRVKQVYHKEKYLNQLKMEIKELEKKLDNIYKNDGVIFDELSKNSKKYLEDKERELIEKEEEEKLKLKNYQEINNKVTVSYNKLIENIDKLYDDMLKWTNQNNNNDDIKYLTTLENSENDEKEYLKLKNFLINSQKKLDVLLLCHNKKEFEQLMANKGKKINLNLDNNFNNIRDKFKMQPKVLHRQFSDAMVTSSTLTKISNNQNLSKYSILKKIKAPKISNKVLNERKIQENIFNNFLKEYKQKRNEELGLDIKGKD